MRIDGAELRCRVGRRRRQPRLHAGRAGSSTRCTAGSINTDAIDNSAGVDTSDHEVNIKILLDGAVRAGELPTDERNALLAVDDRRGRGARARATTTARTGRSTTPRRRRPRWKTCTRGSCARSSSRSTSTASVERLPDDETLTNRRNAGLGLTVPELAVLLAYAKITLEEELLASRPPRRPPTSPPSSSRYFPTALRERFLDRIGPHPLRREIVATALVNGLVNRAGTTFAFRIGEETGASAADIVRAHEAARAIVGQETLWRDIEALDDSIDVDVQTDDVPRVAASSSSGRAAGCCATASGRCAVAATVEFFAARVSSGWPP